MDKPKCRICGSKHWHSEPHIWSDAVSKTNKPQSDSVSASNSKQSASSKGVSATNKPCSKCHDLEQKLAVRDAEIADLKARLKPRRDPEKYRAYQREYMRKRRAQ